MKASQALDEGSIPFARSIIYRSKPQFGKARPYCPACPVECFGEAGDLKTFRKQFPQFLILLFVPRQVSLGMFFSYLREPRRRGNSPRASIVFARGVSSARLNELFMRCRE